GRLDPPLRPGELMTAFVAVARGSVPGTVAVEVIPPNRGRTSWAGRERLFAAFLAKRLVELRHRLDPLVCHLAVRTDLLSVIALEVLVGVVEPRSQHRHSKWKCCGGAVPEPFGGMMEGQPWIAIRRFFVSPYPV